MTIITGGTSGIGEATAEVFAAEGAKVVIAAVRRKKGSASPTVWVKTWSDQRTDVIDEQEIKALIDQTVARFGRLDCLFNNAGGPSRGTLETVTPEDFMYSMNLLSNTLLNQRTTT